MSFQIFPGILIFSDMYVGEKVSIILVVLIYDYNVNFTGFNKSQGHPYDQIGV
jgi:hypothetical protein